MDYADHTADSVATALDFFGQFLDRVADYHERRGQHDWNDLDWRLDGLRPEEVNAREHLGTTVAVGE